AIRAIRSARSARSLDRRSACGTMSVRSPATSSPGSTSGLTRRVASRMAAISTYMAVSSSANLVAGSSGRLGAVARKRRVTGSNMLRLHVDQGILHLFGKVTKKGSNIHQGEIVGHPRIDRSSGHGIEAVKQMAVARRFLDGLGRGQGDTVLTNPVP